MKTRRAPGGTFVALTTCELLRSDWTENTRWVSACPSSSDRLHTRRLDGVYPEIEHPGHTPPYEIEKKAK